MTLPTVADMAERLRAIAASMSGLSGVETAIQFVIDNHLEDWDVPIEETEQTDALRAFTGGVVQLDASVNCYPLGLMTTVLFDEDGNPL